MKTAYEEGQCAFALDVPYTDNPHPKHSANYYEWQRGWSDEKARNEFT